MSYRILVNSAKKVGVLGISALFLVLFLVINKAQDVPVGLILSPPSLTKDLTAGSTFTQEFTITNRTARDDEFVLESRELAVDNQGIFYTPTDSSGDYTSTLEKNGWMNITPKKFSLKIGEKQIVTVTFTLPLNIPTNGYYSELAIFSSSNLNVNNNTGATSAIKAEIAIPLAINLKGDVAEIRKLDILSFKTDKSWYEFTPVKLLANLQNSGNVHVIPSGSIFISRDQSFQNNIDVIAFNKSEQIVLNRGGRVFENTWNNDALRLDEQGNFVFDWHDLSKIRIGQYFAKLNVVWDGAQGKEFGSAIVSFWIIPWKLIFGLIIILLVILLLIFYRRKKYLPVKSKSN